MNKRTISNLFKLFFGVLILAALAAIPCYADEEKTEVRVAYFDLSDYFQVRSDGTIDSLDSAYLDAVSEYTDLKFSYVDCGTWDNALKMLENHEVDLVGTMQWTKEREERFEICDNNYGYAVAELAARAYSDYVYEDYAGINGATVGYLESSATEIQLQDLMEEKEIGRASCRE